MHHLRLPLLAVIAVAGYFIGHMLKFPAAHLLGSMFSVAVFKYFGVIDTFIPPVLTSIALLFIGTGIGGSFNGVRVKAVVTTLLHGLGVGAIMLSLALGFALVSESVSGGSVKALILAFSPGGFAEMALVASGLGIEVTFVIVHQLARYLILLALAPTAVFFIRRKWPSKD